MGAEGSIATRLRPLAPFFGRSAAPQSAPCFVGILGRLLAPSAAAGRAQERWRGGARSAPWRGPRGALGGPRLGRAQKPAGARHATEAWRARPGGLEGGGGVPAGLPAAPWTLARGLARRRRSGSQTVPRGFGSYNYVYVCSVVHAMGGSVLLMGFRCMWHSIVCPEICSFKTYSR